MGKPEVKYSLGHFVDQNESNWNKVNRPPSWLRGLLCIMHSMPRIRTLVGDAAGTWGQMLIWEVKYRVTHQVNIINRRLGGVQSAQSLWKHTWTECRKLTVFCSWSVRQLNLLDMCLTPVFLIVCGRAEIGLRTEQPPPNACSSMYLLLTNEWMANQHWFSNFSYWILVVCVILLSLVF